MRITRFFLSIISISSISTVESVPDTSDDAMREKIKDIIYQWRDITRRNPGVIPANQASARNRMSVPYTRAGSTQIITKEEAADLLGVQVPESTPMTDGHTDTSNKRLTMENLQDKISSISKSSCDCPQYTEFDFPNIGHNAEKIGSLARQINFCSTDLLGM